MTHRFATLATILAVFGYYAFAQGLVTKASKDDWEEINFEYNSSVLSDGYPSLLRLAELLQKNPGYKVRVEGHTDGLGSDSYNDPLGLSRATTVRDFLVKYGARATQIETSTKGSKDPMASGEKKNYTRTDVARWMNRRVVLTVMDDQGRVVGAGGAGEAIRAMPAQPTPAAGMKDCCDDILKKLDKLDDIAKMLRDLTDQNAALRREVDGLKQQQQALESKVASQPKPPTEQQVAGAVGKEIERQKEEENKSKFTLLGLNVGPDSNGNVTFTGRGRYFSPFADNFAFEAQGEYLYFKGQREGQLDFGLVNRIGNFQGGLFSSFKHVTLSGNQNGGTLGQGALTLDYLFKLGKVGLFGTKGFMDQAVINRQNLVLPNGMVAPNVFMERYLSIVDQVGVSTTLGLVGKSYLEANVGYLRSAGHADRPGGTARFILPLNNKIAFTVEGGVNETMLTAGNNGRAVFGVQFGNLLRPREFVGLKTPVPVDVPRVRYEVLTRRVQIGSSPPIADAGPDQIGVGAGTITLDGSKSYDPNGEQLTYAWVKEAGPSVAISGANTAIATFTAGSGQAYTFLLTVKNVSGQQASARVHITTKAIDQVHILFFIANPPTVQAGSPSQLSWQVLNADTVTLAGVGNVQATGSVSVVPTDTTTYKLTATNSVSQDNAAVTVVVQKPQAQLLACYATPTNIIAGESATLNWQSLNADKVTIDNGVGTVAKSGNVVVTPTQNTNYVVTATNAFGSATCSIGVTVTPGQMPRILKFFANPLTILVNQQSALIWAVDNATSLTIDQGVGTVTPTGSVGVSPAQTTTYTLTATNSFGSVTATATVTVTPPPKITSFTATPMLSPAPGAPVVLSCTATNASTLIIGGQAPLVSGIAQISYTGSFTVRPLWDTVYTCTALGPEPVTSITQGKDEQSLTVKVTPLPPH